MAALRCFITNKLLNPKDLRRGDLVRKEIFDLIQKDYPGFSEESYISMVELNRYRKLYISHLIASLTTHHDGLEKEVEEALDKHGILSENIEEEIEQKLTFSQRLSDNIARFGGSWAFIGIYFAFIFVWIGINTWTYKTQTFDPYPYILLNLILSCIAAVQAPIIMMSQNRLEEKDRRRGEYDYKINLKAELEIRVLNEKINHIINQQNKKLMEIQDLQADYLADILQSLEKKIPKEKLKVD